MDLLEADLLFAVRGVHLAPDPPLRRQFSAALWQGSLLIALGLASGMSYLGIVGAF